MLKAFDHVNVRTARLPEMISWYGEVLGLTEGWRPDFPFPGAWLYLGDNPVVHLVGEETPRRPTDVSLEHFAFRAEGLDDFMKVLAAREIAVDLTELTDAGIVQVNIHDPDGNHIHVDFALAERG